MNKTFFESVLKHFFSNLEMALPYIALRVFSIIFLFLIWPKVIHLVIVTLEKISKVKEFDPLLVSFLKSLVKTLMYITFFFMIISLIGIKATSLVAILGAAGVAIGLALQGSLTNLASGLLILFFKHFSKGDFISTEDGKIEGIVLSIHILYTKLQTPNGLIVIIPNSRFANNTVINFSMNDYRRLDLIFSASYENPVNKVIQILEQVIEEEERIIKNDKEMPVLVSLIRHNSSSLDYRFRVWTKNEDYFDVMYFCNKRVKELFDENNIEIPYNKLDLYVKELKK